MTTGKKQDVLPPNSNLRIVMAPHLTLTDNYQNGVTVKRAIKELIVLEVFLRTRKGWPLLEMDQILKEVDARDIRILRIVCTQKLSAKQMNKKILIENERKG